MRAGFHGVQRRIEKVMDVQIQKEMHDVEARLLFLATTGSAAPFIGLFGTVWGIMVSFQAIANSQNTSLNVVAPGIAEALFATAIGLIAAIPATIFYNMYVSDAGKMGGYQRRNSRRRGGHSAMSDINVTPLVDVMLVLLIVFMVAAPLMTVGVPLELPKTQASQINATTEPITVSVQEDGKVFLQETEIGLDALTPKLIAIAKNGYEEQLFVRADTNVPYGKVMEVMGVLNSAGYRKISLITGMAEQTPKTAESQN